MKYANSADMRLAAYPRQGSVQIRLQQKGFSFQYTERNNPLGLSTEDMPKRGDRVRANMRDFLARLSTGVGSRVKTHKRGPSCSAWG